VVLFGLPLWLMLTSLFILGAVIGSFLNVCIYRIPQHERLWDALRGLTHPPSHCPYCQTPIRIHDNIPILGWLLLRGRCRHCRHGISIRYPAIEFLNGLLFVLVYWFEIPPEITGAFTDSSLYTPLGPQGDWKSAWCSPMAVLHWRYLYHMVLVETLVVATFIDFDLRIIPDAVTVPAMIAGLVGGLILGHVYIVPVWFQRADLWQFIAGIFIITETPPPEWLQTWAGTEMLTDAAVAPAWVRQYPHLHGLAVSVAGFLVGGGIVWGVRLIGYWVLRQEAMGFGDVTLMAAIGAFLGWQPTVMVFFLAPLCALVVIAVCWIFLPQREVPYGPYLSLATLIVLLFWKSLWPAAEQIFKLGPLVPLLALVMTLMMVVTLQLLQGIKRLLGIELYPPEWEERWTSGDQLTYLAGEWTDADQGQWPTDRWRGTRTGAGSAYQREWRQGSNSSFPNGWQQNWQRRNGRP